MSMFVHHFWGEKHAGFETLSQNLKSGEQSCKDLEDFIKQFSTIEEQYVKSLGRIIKSIGAYSTGSSFGPVWTAVKVSLEKLSSAHTDLSKKWLELSKDVHKYLESLGKKSKALKDSQTSTQETVLAMQTITSQLAKSKEAYNAKFGEYKKTLNDKPNTKKIEKADADFKKATEDYKTNVSKYNTTVDAFTGKMGEAAEAFQEYEVDHLSQLEQYLQKFASIREDKHTEIGELYFDFHASCSELSVESLLDTFIETKGTGSEAPAHVTFEEVDLSSLPPPPTPDEGSSDGLSKLGSEASTPTQSQASTSSMMHLNITGIFRRNKKKKQSSKDADSMQDTDSIGKQSTTSQPEVDADGYVIRKDEPAVEEYDSDSSTDSEGDKRHRKIKIEIKPKDTGGSISTGNLLDLDNKILSPNSTSRGGTPVSWSNVPLSDNNVSAEDKEVFDTWRATGMNSNNLQSPSPGFPGLPRPPSRKEVSSGRLSASGRISPMSSMMTKQDSFTKQTVQTFSANNNSISEMIPVAVALTEKIESNIRGSDHQSQVKGIVVMSFPSELVRKAELPNLSFSIEGRTSEQIRIISDLISSSGDVHTFKPPALLSYLKAKHAENPMAKHFNIDIAAYTLTVTCLPVNLLARWSCESEVTKVRVDYEYVGSALSKPLPLTQLGIIVPISGNVTQYHADSNGLWSADHKKLLWKMEELKSGAESKGALTAAFKVTDGPSTPASINVKFTCDGSILSGTEFVLKTRDYKVSFSRKQLFANFIVDSDTLV